jgi:tRNA (cmo5U34)-methyltransferase
VKSMSESVEANGPDDGQGQTFRESQWADKAFSQEYLASADHFIPDRFHLFNVLRSFYRTFVKGPEPTRFCDLGCGDGVLTEQLFREGGDMEATLVDGSVEMLQAARTRFASRSNLILIERGFDELIRDSTALGQYQFVISSFAIHHLKRSQRQALFAVVQRHLDRGGYFMNIEATLPDHPAFTEWYYQLWREWIGRRTQLLGLGERFDGVPEKARQNPDNQYSSLSEQLEDLKQAGFAEVECHYKNGMFAIYSGRRATTAQHGPQVQA